MAKQTLKKPATPRIPKKKSGFSLTLPLLELLGNVVSETRHGRSQIVEAILTYGLPHYTKNGLVFEPEVPEKTIATSPDVEQPEVPVKSGAPTAEDLVPDPTTILPRKKDRRLMPKDLQSKSSVPSFVNQVAGSQQQPPVPLYGQSRVPAGEPPAGYIPNFHPRAEAVGVLPVSPVNTPDPQHSRQMYELFMQWMNQYREENIPPPLPPGPVPGAPMPGPNEGFNPLPPPELPVLQQQFAASYPPGYTGPPGVGPAPVPVPVQPQIPQQQIVQPQGPAYMRDPYSMDMGAGSQGGMGGPTAQSLLQGGMMSPGMASPSNNINMQAAAQALGPNWRTQLRQIAARDRRDNG